MAYQEETDATRFPPVRLQLFGQFTAHRADRQIPISSKKAKAILAYLSLLPGKATTRERLADLLWTDRGQEQARGSLRHVLKELRDLPGLSGAISIEREIIGLSSHKVETDHDAVLSAARSRDLPLLSELLQTIRGDLLEDLADLAPGFNDWLVPERIRACDQIFEEALEAVGELREYDMKHAREILRSLNSIDPTNEAAVRLSMRLDQRSGDTSSLHRRYREFCHRLRSEYDAYPSQETRDLFRLLVRSSAERDENAPPGESGGEVALPVKVMEPMVLVCNLQASGPGEALEAFGEACADEMRTAICQLRGLHVLALETDDIDEIVGKGEAALAIYYLTGSVRQIGSGFQCSLKLANAESQLILWAESLRFEDLDVAAIDTLVEKASGVIGPAIDRDLSQKLERIDRNSQSEAARFVRSRLLIRQIGDLPAVSEAVELLEGIVAADPGHIGARLLLARMYNTDFWQQICGHDVASFRSAARDHLAAVVRLQPGHSEVRLRQAWDELRSGNIDRARRIFDGVRPTLPNDPDVVNICAFGYCHLGEFDTADTLMQRAFRLNPFPPSDYHADRAVLLALRGEAEEAEECFAVSGAAGLQYLAVRIANSAVLSQADRVRDLPLHFRTEFRKAWQGSQSPTLHDVMDWVDYTIPLHPQLKRDFVKEELRRMLAPTW